MKGTGIFQQTYLFIIEEAKHRIPYLVYQLCSPRAMLDIITIRLALDIMKVSEALHYLHISPRHMQRFSIPGYSIPMVYPMDGILIQLGMPNGEFSYLTYGKPKILYVIVCYTHIFILWLQRFIF